MKQANLFSAPKREKTISKMRNDFDSGNLRSAQEIVANPGQYGGPDSGLSQWARNFLERVGGSRSVLVTADTRGRADVSL